MRTALLLLVAGLFAAAPVNAAHYHLKADGTGDYATIQAAVNAASSGDTIICADGTYSGTGNDGIDFGGKNLKLKSESNQPKYCVISCSGDRGFYFHSSETNAAVVQGFTIRYGGETNGGGICIESSSPTIVNCVITDCNASNGGGIYVANASAEPNIFNCLIEGNTAYNDGGGLRLYYSNGQVKNCTVANNSGDYAGGISSQGTDTDIINCIIYGNLPHPLENAFYGLFSYNLVEGWTGGGTSFNGAPDFAWGTGGDFYLNQATSDALNAGNDLAANVCATGADGSTCLSSWTTNVNQQDDAGQVDVGYHYPHYNATIDVPTYKPTIQAAIDAAWNGDNVRVMDGTYTGDGNRDLDTKGKRVTVQSYSTNASACIIDCQGSSGSPHRGFYIRKGEGSGTLIKNMKIINGWANYGAGINIFGCSPTIQGCILSGNHATIDGGGIMAQQSGSTVVGCTFTSNSADDAGGGMLNHTCAPTITGCTFQSNTSPYGAGIYNYEASPTLTNCTIRWNEASNSGGGMHSAGTGSNPVLHGCVFDENYGGNGGGIYQRQGADAYLNDCDFFVNYTGTSGRGGGIYNTGGIISAMRCRFGANEAGLDGGGIYSTVNSSATIDSCLFTRNASGSGGGAIYVYNYDLSVISNCTFVANDAPNGGALWTWLSCATEVQHCIFWGNRATTAGIDIGINNNCSLEIHCSDVEHGQGGVYVGGGSALEWSENNFSADPMFCTQTVDGFFLHELSPCAPANSGGCDLVGARPVGCGQTDVEDLPVPAANRLHQSYPNPFNPATRIAFDVAAAGPVSLRIYDVSGRLVRTLVDHQLPAGRHDAIWDGTDNSGSKVASGAYFCRMTAGNFSETRKMVLLR